MNPLSALLSLDGDQKKTLGIQYTPQEIHDQVDLWVDSMERVFKHRQELLDLFGLLSNQKLSILYLAGA
ncbi:MAG: hypothetical protein GX432_11650, partial [Candidatus Atribacteria bacterium]|nr:hypothetical protein [Candidatus Atribacteria bacterium]